MLISKLISKKYFYSNFNNFYNIVKHKNTSNLIDLFNLYKQDKLKESNTLFNYINYYENIFKNNCMCELIKFVEYFEENKFNLYFNLSFFSNYVNEFLKMYILNCSKCEVCCKKNDGEYAIEF